jgi:hypothetical protein
VTVVLPLPEDAAAIMRPLALIEELLLPHQQAPLPPLRARGCTHLGATE